MLFDANAILTAAYGRWDVPSGATADFIRRRFLALVAKFPNMTAGECIEVANVYAQNASELSQKV